MSVPPLDSNLMLAIVEDLGLHVLANEIKKKVEEERGPSVQSDSLADRGTIPKSRVQSLGNNNVTIQGSPETNLGNVNGTGVSQAGSGGGGGSSQAALKTSGTAGVAEPGKETSDDAILQWIVKLVDPADPEKVNQFQSLLAMSGDLPNMSVQDIAQFCGLSESDIAKQASSYTKAIMRFGPSHLAWMGVPSTHLANLAQISSLTGADQSQQNSLATMLSQYEDYLRTYLGSSSTSKE